MSSGIVQIIHGHGGATTVIGSLTNSQVMLETKFFDFDGYHALQQAIGNLEKTVIGVLPEIGEGPYPSFSIYVGVKQRLKDLPSWYGPFSLADGDEMIHTIGVQDGRFFAFRLVDEQPQAVWQMDALEIYGQVGEGRV